MKSLFIVLSVLISSSAFSADSVSFQVSPSKLESNQGLTQIETFIKLPADSGDSRDFSASVVEYVTGGAFNPTSLMVTVGGGEQGDSQVWNVMRINHLIGATRTGNIIRAIVEVQSSETGKAELQVVTVQFKVKNPDADEPTIDPTLSVVRLPIGQK